MVNNINTLVSAGGTVQSGTVIGGRSTENESIKRLNQAASLVSGAKRQTQNTFSDEHLNRVASVASGAKRSVSSSSSSESSDNLPSPDVDIYNLFLATVGSYVKMTDAEKDYYYRMSGLVKENGGSVEEWSQDFLSTNAVANALGVSRTEVLNNRASMLDYYLGIEDQPLTFTLAASLLNAANQGQRQQYIAEAQERYLQYFKDGWDDSSPEVQATLAHILNLEDDMAKHQDSTPRAWYVTWTQNALSQVAYMLDGTVSGIAGSIIGGGLGYLAGGAAGAAKGATIGGNLARFSTYQQQFEASAFWNMKRAGISTETALKYSAIDGLANGLNEAFLDIGYSALMGGFGKLIGIQDLGGKLLPSVVNRVIKDGSLAQFLGKFLLYMGLDASGEFVQESTQSLTSSMLMSLAEKADGLGYSGLLSKEDWKDALEEGIQGFATGLFFGGYTGLLNIFADAKTATKLKNKAIRTLSEESFVNNKQNRNIIQSLRLGGAELTEEQISSQLSGLYKSTQSVREDFKNNIREEILQELKNIDGTLDERVLNNMIISDREIKNEKGEVVSGKGTSVKTREDGSLYFVVDKGDSSEDGKTTTYTMRIANPDVVGVSQLGEMYVDAQTAEIQNDTINSIKYSPQALAMEQAGKITFTINEENGNLTIESVQVQNDSSSLKKQAVQELADMYPDYNIEWNNQTESDKTVFADIESGNPRNTSQKKFGLNYRERISEDDADTAYVRRWLGNKFSEDNSENSLMAALVQAAAKARGLSGKEFIEKYLTAIEDSEYQDDPNVKGYTKTKKDAVTKQVKATIYAGKNADPTTFLHELHHAIMLMGDNMKEFRDIYMKVKDTKQFRSFLSKNMDILKYVLGKKDADGKFVRDSKGNYILDETILDSLLKSDSKWTTADFEFEARLYEAYMRSGQTFNPTLTGFFRRVAETFRKIYTALRNGFSSVKLNDEIVEYYDKLYGYDKTTGQTSSLSGSGELSHLDDRIDNGTSEKTDTLKQDDISSFSAEEQYEAVKAQYYGTDKYMIAPNGRASNLTERQWIQVRTPNFLEWGGDWITDPEHASVILDENDEPKQLYHGSPSAGIEVFDNDGRSINGGENGFTYLTDNEAAAENFSREFTEGSSAYRNRPTGRTGEVYPLFAKMANPLDFRNLTEEDKASIAESFVDNFYEGDDDRTYRLESTKNSIENALKAGNYQLVKNYAEYYLNDISAKGYDGIIAPMGTSEEMRDSLEYAVSSPNQIKSATGNNGSFSVESDNILYQIVNHGSGADFNEFDSKFFSSGAGSQAFGLGFYFTDDNAIAESYASLAYTEKTKQSDLANYKNVINREQRELDRIRKELSASTEEQERIREDERWNVNTQYNSMKSKPAEFSRFKSQHSLPINMTIDEWRDSRLQVIDSSDYFSSRLETQQERLEKAIQQYETVEKKTTQDSYIYRVDIPDSGYLNWDEIVPSSVVDKIAENRVSQNPSSNIDTEIRQLRRARTGEELYRLLEGPNGENREQAVVELSEAGIKGIKYKAGKYMYMPRGANPDAYNYVVFSSSDAQIVEQRNLTTGQSILKQENIRDGERATLQFVGKELQSYSLSESDISRITSFLDSSAIDISDDKTTRENAESTYRKIGTVTNTQTGDNVQFVRASFGKIERHKDYDPRLIGELGKLFEDATFLFDEAADYDTPRGDGTLHKKKSNVGSFSNYGIKISLDGEDYFVRYTTQNIKNRNDRITGRQFHSQQLSSIKISNLPMTSSSFLRAGRSVASDYKLASLLETVNNYVTKQKADLDSLQSQSQQNIEEIATSGESLKQVGDEEWIERAKRIALQAPSLEDFFQMYRERIAEGEMELGDSNTALLLSDIYQDRQAETYQDFDEDYYSDYEEPETEDDFWTVEEVENTREPKASSGETSNEVPDWFFGDEEEEKPQTTASTSTDDDWIVEYDDDNVQRTETTPSSDMPDEVPDWFFGDDDETEKKATEEEQSIKDMEEAVTEVQKVVLDADMPKKLSLDHSRSLDTSLKARSVEFASILSASKEETIRFLQTLKDVNREFFYQEPMYDIVSEEDVAAQEIRRTAFDEFGSISKFIQNLIYDSKGATVSRNLNSLSDRAWKIVAGQVAKNAEVYMDLYARAANNTDWAGESSLEAKVLQEIGLSEKEWNNLSYYKRKMYMQDIADNEMKEKILSGKVYDKDLKEWVARTTEKAEASLAEAKAIEESQKYIIDEDKKTILKLTTEAQDAQKKISDLQTEEAEVQNKIDRLVVRMEQKLKKSGESVEKETLEHGELLKRQNALKRREAQYQSVLEAWQNRNLKKADTAALASELERVRALVEDAGRKVSELLEKNSLTPDEALERLENLYKAWHTKDLADKIQKVKDQYKDKLKKASEDKKDALKSQKTKLSDHYKDRLKQATQDKNDALKKARQDYMALMKQRDALRKMRAEKERLAKRIMKAPSSAVALEEAQQIKAVQALIDPAYRAKTMKTIDGVTYTVEDLKNMLKRNPDDPVFSTLTQRQMERLSKTSLDEMTLAEVDTVYQYVLKLREEGLNKRRSELLQRKSENKIIYSSLMATLRENPKFTEYGFEGTEDKKERMNTKRSKIRDAWYQTLNMARKAQTLDNGEKGVFYDLLIRKKRLLQSEEMRAVMERGKKIESIIKKNKLDESLYKTWSVKLEDGRSVTFTTSELAYIYLSAKNDDNRDAIAYGTLLSVEEKAGIKNAAEKAIIGTGQGVIDARNNKIDSDTRSLGDWRYNTVYALAKEVIEKDKGVFELVQAIESDFNDPSFNRVINLVRKLYNVEVKKEDYYLPLSRTDWMGKEPGEDIKADLLNLLPGTKGTINKGFTKERQVIAPRNQSAVRYDLFKVWTEAVKKQEHFIAMQEYVNQLNSIFETSNKEVNALRAGIRNTYGDSMLEAIDTHIKEIADPNAGAVQSDPAKAILKAAKGNIYSAYLGFKLSSITNQLITSPAAFFGKVGPLRYAKNLLQMTTSFKKTSEEVFNLSPFMKSRNFDVIAGEIKEAAEAVGMPKYKKAWYNFLDFGLKGLEWVDQYTVVAGWKAIYEQELEKLGEATNENIRKAVQIADEYTQETQPQSDKTELAPLYKNKNEMLNILLQFQTSLNVVWNNIAYDTVNNFKKGDFRTALGTMAGYAAAGALLSLAHGDFQPDDDDDDYSFWRTFLYSTMSQGIESIPVFSSYIDSIFGYVVNNEKPGYNTTSITPFPMLAEAFNSGKYTVQAIKEQNTEYLNKAIEKGANALMLGTGLPYSGIKELKAIQDRGVQALVGAR